MLIRLLLALGIITVLVAVIRHIRRQPAEQRPRAAIKYGLYLLAGLLLLLVVTGRVHWIAAAVAALLPLVQKVLSVGLRFLPFISQWRTSRQSQQPPSSAADTGKMTVAQALEIFGLDTVDNVEQITKRHRELMQKCHPDRGGSDFLASQLNAAKEVLIHYVKHR